MLSPHYEVKGLADVGCCDDIPETSDTFAGNAFQKARWLKERYDINLVAADDSGLEVDALGGAPGVYSARYAGASHNDDANNEKLLKNMEGVADRRARFRCAIALLHGDDEPVFFEGTAEGNIISERRGAGGFGYDCLFEPLGWNKTFAEGSAEEKNAISHRGQAVRALCSYIHDTLDINS